MVKSPDPLSSHSAFGGLLASGILKIHGIGSLHTWQQIFFIEGLITMGIAIISYMLLTDSPETAKWLSADEKGEETPTK
jgi:sugar phosphate permease